MRACTLLASLSLSATLAPLVAAAQSTAPSDLPIIDLGYSRYRAASYDSTNDIYHFANIRYADPPVGELRWRKPKTPPTYNSTLQDGSVGGACIQANGKSLNLLGPLNNISPLAGPANTFLDGVLPLASGGQEDCLFLDVYVPGKALRSKNPLPVIFWIYGGGFIFGSKDQGQPYLPLYSGTGILQETLNDVVFVNLNYRVGAFGFLAGTTVEQQGQPNAGFYDQRAALQWLQDHIGLFGGDNTQVTAWGESAGAGSILAHLTAFGGRQDPLFHRAVLQSIASQALIDRRGAVEQSYALFEDAAGCAGQGLSCLRTKSSAVLAAANAALVTSPPVGAFAPGPVPDGGFVRQVPALELASGNFWKGLDGIVLSHVSSEATLFVTGAIANDSDFDSLVDYLIPEYAPGIRAAVESYFPPPGPTSKYATQSQRVEDYLGTTNFLCNYRYLASAYAGRAYALRYAVAPGYHATDLLPTFYNGSVRVSTSAGVQYVAAPGGDARSQTYQSYLTSFSRTGDPNKLARTRNLPGAVPWAKPGGIEDEMLTGVLNVGDLGFSTVTDGDALKSKCDFFREVQAGVTNLGGYAVPGAVVQSRYGVNPGGASVNYGTP